MRITHSHIDGVPNFARELCGLVVTEKALRNFDLQSVVIKDEILFVERLD
jgi:hypothetical protein